MLILRSCADFLPLFTPCEDPAALTAGDGAVGDGNDLSHVRDVHRLQRPSLGIAAVVVGIALRHEEVAAPAFELPHAASREPANPLALLVVDVIPVLRLFNIRYLLLLRLSNQRYH